VFIFRFVDELGGLLRRALLLADLVDAVDDETVVLGVALLLEIDIDDASDGVLATDLVDLGTLVEIIDLVGGDIDVGLVLDSESSVEVLLTDDHLLLVSEDEVGGRRPSVELGVILRVASSRLQDDRDDETLVAM